MAEPQHRPPNNTTGTAVFFSCALGGAWLLALPAVLAQRGVLPGGVQRYMPLAVLGVFSPLIAAVVAAYREGGRRALRDLVRQLWARRLPIYWYPIALGLFGAIYVAGVGAYRLLGGADAARWLYLPTNAQQLLAMLIVPIAEEPGWRGFALPRLERRFGALAGNIALGAAWAAWHAMMFLLAEMSPASFGLALLNIFVGSWVFTWLYHRTRGSLLIAILAHAGAHLNNPGHATGNDAPMIIYTTAMAIVACTLLALDRRWRESRGNA
jgi:membrane protease YdiL (CAAX protease family)